MTLEEKILHTHTVAKSLAFQFYLRTGRVPRFVIEAIKATASVEAMYKYNPYHVPAGVPEGGQFDFGSGGDYEEPGLGHPLAPWELLLSRKPIIEFLGFVFRQAIGQSYYNLNNRRFSSHSLIRMEERQIPPSVIENTIRTGVRSASRDNTTVFYDKVNNITVVRSNKNGQIVTVRKGKP